MQARVQTKWEQERKIKERQLCKMRRVSVEVERLKREFRQKRRENEQRVGTQLMEKRQSALVNAERSSLIMAQKIGEISRRGRVEELVRKKAMLAVANVR